MIKVVIAYHSGYGHTRRLADAVREGAASLPVVAVQSLEVDKLDEKGWDALAAADAIVFGAPTDMGGASGAFKMLADATAKVWASLGWKDKVNRLGGWIGVMAQADNLPPEQSPPAGDLESARLYGRRIAEQARAMRRAQ